ncbi:hypothetical protein Tco_0068781, partial [Tanacetum coccineum]
VMSSSTVTYTSISSYSDLPPWGFHFMDPAKLEAPPSLDYVLGPEHPPSPDYVPGLEGLEQVPLSLDYVPERVAKVLALSPGYVADSNPEEDPADYPVDGGDDDDDESFDDDDDDDDDKEEEQEAFEDDEEEEEEYPALADSSVIPVDDHDICQPQTPRSAATEALITVVAAALPLSPPPSRLTLLSSLLPQIPSPPLPLPSPPTYTSPTIAEAPLGYRVAGIRLRVASPSIRDTITTPVATIYYKHR